MKENFHGLNEKKYPGSTIWTIITAGKSSTFFLHIKERKRKPQQLEYAQEPINLRNKKGEKYKKKKKKKERNNLENNFNLW